MDIILIPGFWLDGSSWSGVLPTLEQAGHRTSTTPPGPAQARNATTKSAPEHNPDGNINGTISATGQPGSGIRLTVRLPATWPSVDGAPTIR